MTMHETGAPAPSRRPASRGAEALASWTQRSEKPLLGFALLFLLLLVVQALTPDRATWLTVLLRAGEVLVWLAFAVDYGTRLRLAPDRRHFVRTHLLDLMALLAPFLRPLRLLALIGIFGTSARRAGDDIRNGLVFIGGLAVLLVVSAAALMTEAEREAEGANITGFADALWWATVTITTVGYGDRYPVTFEGRAIAAVLMVVGIALLGLITAAVATWFVKHSAEQALRSGDDADPTLTTLVLISERVERIEQAQAAARGETPCPHCARTPSDS